MRSLHRMDQHIFHGYQGRFSEGLNTPAHDGFLLSLSLIMLPLSELASCFPLMFSNTSVDYGNKKADQPHHVWKCQIDFLFCEMSNWFPVLRYMEKKRMHDELKSFYFRCAKENFLFILSNCHGNAFSVENIYEFQFPRFRDENIVYLVFKLVLN